jgi:pseudouridine kinase
MEIVCSAIFLVDSIGEPGFFRYNVGRYPPPHWKKSMTLMDSLSHPDGPVLVIGASGIDLVGRLQSDLHQGSSTAARIRTSFGGAARNVAENLVRLGHEVTLMTAVGDDEPGERLLQQLVEAGVDTGHVLCCQDRATGTYLAVVDRAGELRFALDDMRVMRSLTPDYLKSHESAFREASVLVLDMNLEPKTLRTAVSLARKAGLPIFADPTSAALAARMVPYLDRMYFISPNSEEVKVLSGINLDPEDRDQVLSTANSLVGKGVEIVVITLSEFGLCYATQEAVGFIPAIATDITDPTGAGDALTAAVIFALLNDIPLDDAMRLGVSAASLTLRYPGAVRPDLSLEELYNHLVI